MHDFWKLSHTDLFSRQFFPQLEQAGYAHRLAFITCEHVKVIIAKYNRQGMQIVMLYSLLKDQKRWTGIELLGPKVKYIFIVVYYVSVDKLF